MIRINFIFIFNNNNMYKNSYKAKVIWVIYVKKIHILSAFFGSKLILEGTMILRYSRASGLGSNFLLDATYTPIITIYTPSSICLT